MLDMLILSLKTTAGASFQIEGEVGYSFYLSSSDIRYCGWSESSESSLEV